VRAFLRKGGQQLLRFLPALLRKQQNHLLPAISQHRQQGREEAWSSERTCQGNGGANEGAWEKKAHAGPLKHSQQ